MSVQNMMNYYIVDSVKGGCGKTLLAIREAVKIANELNEKVCFIDLDLLGTSIEEFLKITHISELNNHNICYFSDLFYGKKISVDRCIRKLTFNRLDMTLLLSEVEDFDLEDNDFKENHLQIGAAFSSPSENLKKLFKPSVTTNYQHHVDYDFFARKLEKLLNQLKEGGYRHIVIDMPPNSDPYTDSIFNLLLNRNRYNSAKNTGEEHNVELLLVSTFDRSHVRANLEWLNDKISAGDHNWIPFNKVSFLFNDVRGVFAEESNEKNFDLAVMQYETMISEYPSIHQIYRNNNVKYLYVHYNKEISIYSIIDKIDNGDAHGNSVISIGSGTSNQVTQSGLSLGKITIEEIKMLNEG